MNNEFAHQILASQFQKTNFTELCNHILPDLVLDERDIEIPDKSLFTEAILIGTSEKCKLSVILTHCKPDHIGKRIGITQDAFKILRHHGIRNALIAIDYGEEQWRLSLLTSALDLIDGKIITTNSNPRRYSYLLGEGAKTNTPFKYLIEKSDVDNIDDLRECFSAEIVNKEFFEQIATLFTELVGGKRGAKEYEGLLSIQGHSPGSQHFQEFAVRLIGRVVFCWFLKEKKSSSGIPLVPSQILSVEAINDKNSRYNHAEIDTI